MIDVRHDYLSDHGAKRRKNTMKTTAIVRTGALVLLFLPLTCFGAEATGHMNVFDIAAVLVGLSA